MKIFDGPSVTECYSRRPTVVPQQALALSNSDLALKQARTLAARLISESESDAERLVDLARVRAGLDFDEGVQLLAAHREACE